MFADFSFHGAAVTAFAHFERDRVDYEDPLVRAFGCVRLLF